jgi:hypothetical protein
MAKKLSINMSELSKELDKLRENTTRHFWSPEATEIVRIARDNKYPVSYATISKFLKEKLNILISPTAIMKKYKNDLKKK